ncbi:unnamed protein product [Camellia sinensis]
MHLSSKLAADGDAICLDVDSSSNIIITNTCKCLNRDNKCNPASQWFKVVNSTRSSCVTMPFFRFNSVLDFFRKNMLGSLVVSARGREYGDLFRHGIKFNGMDSQTPTDAYFTNLLQGGSNLLGEFMMKSPNQMGQCSSQHGEVAGQESPLSPQIESTTKKSQRGGNFSTEEDNLLVSAWLNTSLDAIHGNEQKHKTYWNRVWEYFHKYKTFTSERNQNSLMNRWSTIQLGTNKFCGFFAQIESMHQSGVNEQDKIGKAKLMYQEFQKASFPFEHCWNVLRYQPKWLEECEKKKPKKKKTSATSSPFAPEAINLADDDVSHDAYVDLERPLGRKAEKERLNKRKSKDSAGSNYAGILNGIMEDKKKANDKKMEILEKACLQEQEQNRINQELEQERIRIMKEEIQERFRIKQEKIRAEQLKEEERIIMMDTNDSVEQGL